MLKTSNYNMNKPESTDVVDINNLNDNFDILDTEIKKVSDMANYIQTAGGTATAITLTNVTLEKGFTVTFIVAANNSGAATTINGKALYKPNTTTAPTLVGGKAVTVWYRGTSFFIKASAEGTAVAANVLAGNTFSNDADTGLTGTMPNNGTVSQSLGINGSYTIPAGYHNGSGKVSQSITTKTAATYSPSTSAQSIAAGQYLSGTQTIAATTGTAAAPQVLQGQTFNSANGIGLTGSCAPQIPNLLDNGSFEKEYNGEYRNGWNYSSTVTIDTTYHKSGSRCIKSYTTDTSVNVDLIQQISGADAGHIYYACGWFLRTASIPNVNELDIIGGATEMNFFSCTDSNLPTTGTWYFLSAIATGVSGDAAFRFFNFNTNPIYVDCLMLLDLTTGFGSGKEPSKSQMDAIVHSAGGWWDSIIVDITAKAVLDPAMLVSGYSGYDDGLLKHGTMPNHGTNNIPGSQAGVGNSGIIYTNVPTGYCNGGTNVYLQDPNYIASNILSGVSIFGLSGSAVPKRMASGTVTSSTDQMSFRYSQGSSTSNYYVLASQPFGFTPSIVVCSYTNNYYTWITLYCSNLSFSYGTHLAVVALGNGAQNGQPGWCHVYLMTNARVDSEGFLLPVVTTASLNSWIAIE